MSNFPENLAQSTTSQGSDQHATFKISFFRAHLCTCACACMCVLGVSIPGTHNEL